MMKNVRWVTYDVVCDAPGHKERRDEPGWTTLLGKLSLPADVPPALKLKGHWCDACARASRAAQPLIANAPKAKSRRAK
jgi:hypothetical protein